MDRNFPSKCGLYLARSKNFGWWNLVVEVYGESPFFRVNCWNRYEEILNKEKFPEDLIWGPEIEVPEIDE